MALHLPIGPLKTRSGLEPVPRCTPSTCQPISRCHNHCAIGAGLPISQITQLYSLGLQDGGESLLEFNNRLSNWQTTPTKSLGLQDGGESLLEFNNRLSHWQITPTTSLWLQDGGESLLHYNIRLTHSTDNTNIFSVSAWWSWISTTLQQGRFSPSTVQVFKEDSTAVLPKPWFSHSMSSNSKLKQTMLKKNAI